MQFRCSAVLASGRLALIEDRPRDPLDGPVRPHRAKSRARRTGRFAQNVTTSLGTDAARCCRLRRQRSAAAETNVHTEERRERTMPTDHEAILAISVGVDHQRDIRTQPAQSPLARPVNAQMNTVRPLPSDRTSQPMAKSCPTGRSPDAFWRNGAMPIADPQRLRRPRPRHMAGLSWASAAPGLISTYFEARIM